MDISIFIMEYKVRIKKIFLILTPIFTVGLLYAIFIEMTGLGLDCIIYENTGIKCPSCGITRMCMNILHCNFEAAFAHNQLLFVTLPIALLWMLYKVMIYIKTGNNSNNKFENLCIYFFLVAVVIFSVIRNI